MGENTKDMHSGRKHEYVKYTFYSLIPALALDFSSLAPTFQDIRLNILEEWITMRKETQEYWFLGNLAGDSYFIYFAFNNFIWDNIFTYSKYIMSVKKSKHDKLVHGLLNLESITYFL